MLEFGDPIQNILTLIILGGFGYIVYSKWKGNENNKFKDLFSKAKEFTEKVNIKGGGGSIGK